MGTLFLPLIPNNYTFKVSNMNSPTAQDEIGHVLIGKSGSLLGQSLWKSVMSNPGHKITKWLPLTLKW
ncbi:hypothetical protein D918_05494 [Trichuris suis]|nr:hypothetical protein D918_05494 [Trichuris suis]